MTTHDPIQDVEQRRKQLEVHLLRSHDYLHQADQTLKRQTTTLYLAIALLFSFQIAFTVRYATWIPFHLWVLITLTSALAMLNCVLLIRTKRCLRRLNQAWLQPYERNALESLEEQRERLLKTEAADDDLPGPGR